MRHSEGQKLLLASLKRNFSPDQEAAVAEEEGFLSFEDSAANRSIGKVVQSRRRPLLGPSPG